MLNGPVSPTTATRSTDLDDSQPTASAQLESRDGVGLSETVRQVKVTDQSIIDSQPELAAALGTLSDLKHAGLPAHLAIAGPLGTGQEAAARALLAGSGDHRVVTLQPSLLASPEVNEAVAVLGQHWDSSTDGVLHLCDLELLLSQQSAMAVLEALRELISQRQQGPSLVVSGDPESIARLHALNPALYTYFVHARTEALTGPQLATLIAVQLERDGFTLDEGFSKGITQRLDRIGGVGNLQNDRVASAVSYDVSRRLVASGRRHVRADDIDTNVIRLVSTDSSAAFDQLAGLIGLADVKRTVHLWTSNSTLTLRRQAMGLIAPGAGQHMVFKGPAGTAKTTVARIVARILAETGVLASGHLVEVDKSDLVADQPELTARRVVDVVKRSFGGVLFIDEAYSLTAGAASAGSGRVVVDTLLKLMEDYRDEFVVIVAGYPTEMETFLSSNPGLRSRFVKVLNFPAYGVSDLFDILEHLAAQRGFIIEAAVRDVLTPRLTLQSQYPGFGNGRHMRNLLDTAIELQGARLTGDCSDDDLRLLTTADFAEQSKFTR